MEVKKEERDRQRECGKVEEQGPHKASTELKRSGDRNRNRERRIKLLLHCKMVCIGRICWIHYFDSSLNVKYHLINSHLPLVIL